MAWALWLAAPLVTTALVALATWRRGRPPRLPDSDEAIRAHQDYLDALTAKARGTARVSRD
jgi:hypothetical protein